MIALLFLTAALAVPSSFTGGHYDPSVFRMLASFYDRGAFYDLSHSPLQNNSSNRMVVVSDRFDYVDCLRRLGIQAWQMSPFSGTSRWSIQGDLGASPIKRGTMHIAWVEYPVRRVVELLELMWMVRENGFLIVDLQEGGWALLRSAGFSKTTIEMTGYEIWRRGA